MYIQTLQIQRVRNLESIKLACAPGINLFYGNNAAGKTSILEAIYVLSHSNSFRTPRIDDVIQQKQKQLTIVADIQDLEQKPIQAGIERTRTSTLIKIGGKIIKKRSEQARKLPVFILSPENQQLVTGTPKNRRKWLDWNMFHVEHGYMDYWHRYHNLLRQRNALLRHQSRDEEFGYWEEQLAQEGENINRARTMYLKNLQEKLGHWFNIQAGPVTLEYNQENINKEDILEKLDIGRKNDRQTGCTQYGAHRSDVIIRANSQEASKTQSQGQNKRLQLYLLLAQAELYQEKTEQNPIILLDDLPAELDHETRRTFIQSLSQHRFQVFITAIEKNQVPDHKILQKMFHVEHGNVTEMIE